MSNSSRVLKISAFLISQLPLSTSLSLLWFGLWISSHPQLPLMPMKIHTVLCVFNSLSWVSIEYIPHFIPFSSVLRPIVIYSQVFLTTLYDYKRQSLSINILKFLLAQAEAKELMIHWSVRNGPQSCSEDCEGNSDTELYYCDGGYCMNQ